MNYNFWLIDDDEVHNAICERIIKSVYSNVQITAFTKVKEVFDMIKNPEQVYKLPDIIFLDINMPILNGWDFLKEFDLYRDHLPKDIIIILLTSSIHEGDINKSKEFPVVREFVSKPLTVKILKGLEEKFLHKS